MSEHYSHIHPADYTPPLYTTTSEPERHACRYIGMSHVQKKISTKTVPARAKTRLAFCAPCGLMMTSWPRISAACEGVSG